MNLQTVLINIPFLVACLLLIIKIPTSIKRGFVKELCSVVSIIIASVLVLLIAFAIKKYVNQERLVFCISVVLLILLLIIYKIIDLGLTTLKLISKLPVVSFFNKIIALPFAIFEVVVLIWAVYCLVMVLDAGALGTWIMNCVRVNPIMKFLYQYNYMYNIVAKFSETLKAVDIFAKPGM